jgi:hypothetical protein
MHCGFQLGGTCLRRSVLAAMWCHIRYALFSVLAGWFAHQALCSEVHVSIKACQVLVCACWCGCTCGDQVLIHLGSLRAVTGWVSSVRVRQESCCSGPCVALHAMYVVQCTVSSSSCPGVCLLV